MSSTFIQQFAKKKTVLERSSKKYLEEALYKKLLSDGGKEIHVRAKLNEFLKSRKSAYKWEVGLKLYGPVPRAEKCFQEWATAYSTGCTTFYIRIANVLIGAYLREGSLEKADKLRKQAKRRGATPNAKTWEHYIDYYLKKREFKSVVKCVDNAVTTGRGNRAKWTPSTAIVEEVMRHFEQSKGIEAAEGFLEILKKSTDELGPKVFESLIRTYVAAGKKSPILHRRVKMQKVELSEEGKILLDEISME